MGRLIVSAQMTVDCVMDPIEGVVRRNAGGSEMALRNCVPRTRSSSDARPTRSWPSTGRNRTTRTHS